MINCWLFQELPAGYSPFVGVVNGLGTSSTCCVCLSVLPKPQQVLCLPAARSSADVQLKIFSSNLGGRAVEG
jgi:hypothetical protein